MYRSFKLRSAELDNSKRTHLTRSTQKTVVLYIYEKPLTVKKEKELNPFEKRFFYE